MGNKLETQKITSPTNTSIYTTKLRKECPIHIFSEVNFSPAKACLLQKLYGNQWYTQIWQREQDTFFDQSMIMNLKRKNRSKIAFNIYRWVQVYSDQLALIDWHWLLQSCIDFNLVVIWRYVIQQALKSQKWSLHEKTLLFLTW